MRVAVYVTGHWFGHASRAGEVVRELLATAPEVTLDVRTEALRTPMARAFTSSLDGTHCLGALSGTGRAASLEFFAWRGLAVLTNKPEALSRKILAGLDLCRWMIEVVGGDTLPTRKPDPSGVEHLRELTRTAR